MTTFTAGPGIQTLPLWIFHNLFRPNQAPVVNVVAAFLVLVSILPIYLAHRLSVDTAAGGRSDPLAPARMWASAACAPPKDVARVDRGDPRAGSSRGGPAVGCGGPHRLRGSASWLLQ